LLFELRRLRFSFRAEQPIRFGASAANTFRGALGTELRSVVSADVYARIFEPRRAGTGPSGLNDLPRPFVLRTRHLDSRLIEAGSTFAVDLHLFALPGEIKDAFRLAFKRFEVQGLGPARSAVTLLEGTAEAVAIDLSDRVKAVSAIRVHLLSPTELKCDHDWTANPDFVTLACRIRDRISTLRQFYGPGPLPLDFRAFAERAALIRTVRSRLVRAEALRHSSRTGQSHSLGGVIGEVEYAGVFAEFLPYLEAARWTGVGRQTVWGKGELLTQPLAGET
jgi:CRISPR-associated endoribonuclease Cas6